jgi:hypothetical protein
MNATQVKRLQISHFRRTSNSPPAGSPPSTESYVQADNISRPEGSSETPTPRSFVRERLIVIGYVAAAPIAIGGWLWLLGWIALSIVS